MSDEYLTMRRVGEALVITRSARAFRSRDTVVTSWASAKRWVEEQPAPRRIIVDQRKAQGRNDAAFEALILQSTRPVIDLAERGVILVESAAGLLQLTRHMAGFGASHFQVCREVPEAARAVGCANDVELLAALQPSPTST